MEKTSATDRPGSASYLRLRTYYNAHLKVPVHEFGETVIPSLHSLRAQSAEGRVQGADKSNTETERDGVDEGRVPFVVAFERPFCIVVDELPTYALHFVPKPGITFIYNGERTG